MKTDKSYSTCEQTATAGNNRQQLKHVRTDNSYSTCRISHHPEYNKGHTVSNRYVPVPFNANLVKTETHEENNAAQQGTAHTHEHAIPKMQQDIKSYS